MMVRPRILIADDHTLVAEACKQLLEPRFAVIGVVADGRTLVKAADQLRPDVAVLDVGMPNLNGLDAAQQLKEKVPNVKIIVLTMNEDTDLASEALRRGASGYLLKTSAAGELAVAIESALRGVSYVTPRIAQKMMDNWVRDPRQGRGKTLTARQREVLQLLAEGRTMKEIAALLRVTPRTVAFHKYKIMEDFGLKNNAGLVQFAIKQHIVSAA
jgi:DNA-binding NarL/FixJ family response regulator